MKYNELKINWGGQAFVFITRGKAFTKEEAFTYLKGRKGIDVGEEIRAEAPKVLDIEVPDVILEDIPEVDAWKLPDDKHRRLMFLHDLRVGKKFCVAKYGVTWAEIIAEAHRVAPHLNVAE